ncbi:MAG: PHP domain-containing protein [Desulfobacterales bacterium]|nr:PHP domain-containing protein [Desulfobacterales bacterium]
MQLPGILLSSGFEPQHRDRHDRIRSPARAHPVQPAGRGDPHRRPDAAHRRIRHAGRGDHRPRHPVRRRRVLRKGRPRPGSSRSSAARCTSPRAAGSTRTRPTTASSCHIILLAENQEGYRNLCRLATAAQLEGFYYRPRIDRELLEGVLAGPDRHVGLPARRNPAPDHGRAGWSWPSRPRATTWRCSARTGSSSRSRTTASTSRSG